MEISSSCNKLSTSQSVNSLFDQNNTGLLLEALDESEKSRLLELTTGIILNKKENLGILTDELILSAIENYSTTLFRDAVEGLAIIVKQNHLSSLKELDNWMEKEEQRCLAFLKSPQHLAANC